MYLIYTIPGISFALEFMVLGEMGNLLRVAVDAMGGDFAPVEIVKGALSAVKEEKELEVILVGFEDAILQSVGRKGMPPRTRIVHAEEVIGNKEDPGLAIRSKKKASMVVAMQLVRRGEADAVISAGSTGALMAGGLLFLGRINGIRRPALLTVIPTFKGGRVVVLDVGANVDAKPEQMLQYAIMGKIFAQEIQNKKDPRIALLNIGSEENKGSLQVKNTYKLFKDKLDNFSGNMEAREIFQNGADVLICDGFVGNIMLKAIEGISRDMFAFLREEIKQDLKARIASTMLFSIFNRVRANFDETEHGGAQLIGVNGACIKCHGASKEKTIKQALIKQAYPLVQNNIQEKIEQAVSSITN